MVTKQQNYRAFRTKAQGTESIVFADSAGTARSVTVMAANEAGYGVRYQDVSVRRAPEFDGMKMDDGSPANMRTCYIAEYLQAHN